MAYQNFMGNKDFHPSSFRNIKKMYEAEEKAKLETSRQEELRVQYLREQEVYKNKEQMGKANPLGFMYEPPPGFNKEKEKVEGDDGNGEPRLKLWSARGVSPQRGVSSQRSNKEKEKMEGDDGNGEPRLKFDWQKAGRAPPREEHAKGMELRDQPFGVEVRNVKCIKCGKWGHINTDRVCPLFGKAKPVAVAEPSEAGEEEAAAVAPAPLPDIDTVEDGLIFKQCVRDKIVDSMADNQQILASDDETEIQDLMAGLSKKERKRVLKKLSHLKSKEEGVASTSVKKKRKKKDKDHKEKKRSRRARTPDSSPESSSGSEEDKRHSVRHSSRERQSGRTARQSESRSGHSESRSGQRRDSHHRGSDRRRHEHRTRDRSPHR